MHSLYNLMLDLCSKVKSYETLLVFLHVLYFFVMLDLNLLIISYEITFVLACSSFAKCSYIVHA